MPNFDGQDVGKISIKVVPNLDGFRAELRRELAEIEKTERGKVTVDVDADTKGVREKIEAAAKDTTAKVNVDVDRGVADRLQQNIDKLVRKTKIGVDLDREDFNRVLAEAKALAKQADVKLNINIKDTEAEAKLAETIAKLKLEAAAANIKLKVDIDHDVVKRSFGLAAREGVKSFFTSFKNNISLLSDDTMLIAAAVLSLGAPLVGTLTAAIAGLPALLAGILTPIGAVVLGLDGITKAAKPVVDAFGRMSEAISGKFEKALTPLFKRLTDLEPLLTSGFSRVADGLVRVFNDLGETLMSGSNGLAFTRIFDNVARGLEAMSPGIQSFTQALIDLTDKGTEHLKGLGDWFSGLMDRISNSVSSVISNGQFDKAISGLKPVLEGLANGIGNIFSTAFDWFSNPANSQRTGDFIEQLGSLVKGALKVSEVVFPVLERLGEYIGRLVDQFSTSGEIDLSGLLGQIGKDISEAAAWEDIGKSIGTGIIHGITGVLGEFFSSDRLLASIPVIGAPLAWAKHLFGGKDSGKDIVDQLIPPQASAAAVAQANANAQKFSESLGGTSISNSFDEFTKSIIGDGKQQSIPGGSLSDILGGPQTTQQLVDGFSSSLNAAVPQVQQQVADAKKQIAQAAQQVPAGTGLDGGVGGASVTAQVQQNTQQLQSTISQGLSGLKQTAAEKFGEVVDAAQEAIDKIIPKFAELPGKIVAALGDLGGTLKPAGQQLMAGLQAGIEAGFASVLDRVKKMAGEIAANKGPLPYDRTVLVENGKALMEGLGTGIERGFQGVLDQAKGLAARIQEAMENGSLTTNLGVFKQQYQRQMDALTLQRQELQMQLSGTTDNGQKKALREQLQQLSTVRETLQAQSQQLRLTDRYGGALDHSNDIMSQMLSKMTQAAQAVGQANAQQMMSDLGISGQGAIPQLANLGIGYMSQMLGNLFSQGGMGGVNIQVNSVDEALAARQNIVNKQALRYDRR